MHVTIFCPASIFTLIILQDRDMDILSLSEQVICDLLLSKYNKLIRFLQLQNAAAIVFSKHLSLTSGVGEKNFSASTYFIDNVFIMN